MENNKESRVAASIVLYNPDLDLLRKNLDAILPQVERVYLVDNGSANVDEAEPILPPKAHLIKNGQNLGIARALNVAFLAAERDGFDWVMTLDQDSVCPEGMVAELLSSVPNQKTGVICPVIHDRSSGYSLNPNNQPGDEVVEISTCITSGSLTNVRAWRDINGFDEWMFIDMVDHEFNDRLRRSGWSLYRDERVELSHEVGGNGTWHKFLIWPYPVNNHVAFRKYYIARNRVYRMREAGHGSAWAVGKNALLLAKVLAWEDDKPQKAKSILKGTIDGFREPTTRSGMAHRDKAKSEGYITIPQKREQEARACGRR